MTWRAFGSSTALHASAVAAIWLGCLTGQSGPVIVDPPPGPLVFVPVQGSAPARTNKGRPGPGRREPPGASIDLEGVKLTIDDAAAEGMLASLKQWKGRVTDCSPDAAGWIRFWIYQPDQWPETASMDGIPCADFPGAFATELASRVESEAKRARLTSPVRSVIIGFSRNGAFHVVSIG